MMGDLEVYPGTHEGNATMQNLLHKSWRISLAAMVLLFVSADNGAWGQTQPPQAPPRAQTNQPRPQRTVTLETTGNRYAGEFAVPLNKSQVLRLERPFTDLTVGNPAIADVLPLTNQTIYVLGKAIGSTNMLIYGQNRQLIAIVDLAVVPDVTGLRARLHELLPNERVEVRQAGSSIVLSGTLSSANTLTQALSIAQRYIGTEQADRGITNLMSVRGSQQVMLAVRFAEVSRNALKDVGVNLLGILTGNPAVSFRSNTIVPPAIPGTIGGRDTAFAVGRLFTTIGSFSLAATIDALETKGLAKILAEPNLVALSGDTASFLAGGEFPVPVAQTGSAAGIGASTAVVTVEFKRFGVSLGFTPTVIDQNRINLVVAPEVSQLDFANAVTLSGFVIPSLRVRRAATTIELGNGQSFAIAGLLENTFTNSINQFPWLGDVPILGLLFRSTQYQRNETELVIVVTPYIVKPTAPDAIVTPADRFVPPSETDMFLYGRLTGSKAGPTAPASAVPADSLKTVGGISGPYGHILQ